MIVMMYLCPSPWVSSGVHLDYPDYVGSETPLLRFKVLVVYSSVQPLLESLSHIVQ